MSRSHSDRLLAFSLFGEQRVVLLFGGESRIIHIVLVGEDEKKN
jgi:hypothetical protein